MVSSAVISSDMQGKSKVRVEGSLWAYAGPERSQLKGIDHDCNDIPDAAMTLAVAALFAQGQTRIRNVYNWRVKVCLAVFIHTCPMVTNIRLALYHHASTSSGNSMYAHGGNPKPWIHCLYSWIKQGAYAGSPNNAIEIEQLLSAK